MATSLQRLSSGLRINSAADDAAGLAISETLRSQTNGLDQATSNAQDGMSLIQTAEGALNESTAILQRMRQLAVQSANDTNSTADRGAIQKEVTSLGLELDRLGNQTSFNGKQLLNGSFSAQQLQIGANANQAISVSVGDMRAAALGLTGGGATAAAANGAGALTTAMTGTPPLGSFTITGANVFDSSGLQVGTYAASVVTFTAAATPGTVTFDKAPVDVAGNGSFSVSNGIDVSTQAGANTSITALDTAITAVSGQRADLGAVQNTLQHVVNSLSVASENASAAESRIRDTDMAKEMTNFTRAQILQQAGTAMLAQANSAPQSVLKLLG